MLEIHKGSCRFLMRMVLKDDDRVEIPCLDLTAQGFEVESTLTHRLMQIFLAIVVVKVKFEQPVTECIQPLL